MDASCRKNNDSTEYAIYMLKIYTTIKYKSWLKQSNIRVLLYSKNIRKTLSTPNFWMHLYFTYISYYKTVILYLKTAFKNNYSKPI